MRPAPSCATPANWARHQRHRPEETTLYRIVESHLNPFLAFVDTQTGGSGLPTFVTDEFDAILACGILAHGLLRLRCDGCKEEKRVVFSVPQGDLLRGAAPRLLSLVRHAPHGSGRGPSGGPCHPEGSGAPMGAGIPDSPAQSVRRPSRLASPGVTDHPSPASSRIWGWPRSRHRARWRDEWICFRRREM